MWKTDVYVRYELLRSLYSRCLCIVPEQGTDPCWSNVELYVSLLPDLKSIES